MEGFCNATVMYCTLVIKSIGVGSAGDIVVIYCHIMGWGCVPSCSVLCKYISQTSRIVVVSRLQAVLHYVGEDEWAGNEAGIVVTW